eukprot:3028429-Rhodomonas_salina.2
MVAALDGQEGQGPPAAPAANVPAVLGLQFCDCANCATKHSAGLRAVVMRSEMLLERSGAKVAASDGCAATSSRAVLQQICAGRAFVPIQHLCCAKQLIWTPMLCMHSGMLQGHVGAKVAASDGHAASSRAVLQQICAGLTFEPIQHLCSAKELICTLTHCMCSGMLQWQGQFAADLCPMSFSSNSAFVQCQAADLHSDALHELWDAVRACRCQVAAADGRAASCKGLMQLICSACTAVLPLWVVPSQECCWSQSCSHECRNVASACGCQVSCGSVRWSWNKQEGHTDPICIGVWRPSLCGDHSCVGSG